MQTRGQLEDREIKINFGWVFYATQVYKWVITTKETQCPRGEIGRHKGLKT